MCTYAECKEYTETETASIMSFLDLNKTISRSIDTDV